MMPFAHGPDVSHYQTVISESAIPAFRLASCKLAEGRSYLDPAAQKWIDLFRRKHVRNLGVYFWLRSDSLIEVQFANMVTRLGQVGLAAGNSLTRGTFLQLDWETTQGIADLTVAEVEEYVTLVHRRYGDRIIVYGSDWVPGFIAWRKRNPDVPVWYANYNLGDKPTGGAAECKKYDAAVWQWSATYKCPGIAGGIDMNHVFDWAILDRLCGLTTTPDSPPDVQTPPAAPNPTPRTITALQAAGGDTDMQLRIVADKSKPDAPERWVTNGMVRVIPTEHSLDWLTRTGQASGTIVKPEWLTPDELAGLPVVGN